MYTVLGTWAMFMEFPDLSSSIFMIKYEGRDQKLGASNTRSLPCAKPLSSHGYAGA